MLKKILLILLLLSINSFAMDKRLEKYPEAKRLYKIATQDRSELATFDLARFYQTTLPDSKEAIYWYKKSYEYSSGEAAKEYGSGAAALNLGSLYDDLKQYKKAIEWYKKAYERDDIKSAFNLGLLYKQRKNYPKAIEWYKKSYAQGNKSGAYNLAILYDDIYKDYPKAIEWYKKSYELGSMSGACNLGYLYDVILKDEKNGIYWYKKAAKGGDSDAIKNLGNVYHEKGDSLTGAAYIFAMVNYGYSKKEVLEFLKNDWKIDEPTLKKAYKLQQTLDIPKHYTGGIN